ncbi:MAG TPA: patatin-like phospholipase family protein [Ktedonobacterales bacterium]|nr:patatin-like phospholipase family protein [Ktedonobacterales bacterium]
MFTSMSGATGKADSAYGIEQGSVEAASSSILRLRSRQARPAAGATAFVFSGGGARGALHVGALRALLEAGIHPDMLVGASIGAWNAAWLAQSPTLEGIEALAEIWRNLQAGQILLGQRRSIWSCATALRGLLMLAALRRIAGGCSSLYSDTGLRQILSQRFADLAFEDMALPLSVIATNLSHGGRAVFKRGTLVDALLASSAIPGIFPPVSINGALYADGGIVDGCSVETAIDMGARRIFVLAIGYDAEAGDGAAWVHAGEQALPAGRGMPRHSAPSVIQRASQVMGNYQIQRALERTPSGVEAHLISLSSGVGGGTLSFGNVAELIERAYQSTRGYLATTYATTTASARPLSDALESARSA